jgi:hypothetical protein
MYHLINENNIRFSLKDFVNKAFIPRVAGLGYKRNLSYVKVGNYYKTNYDEIAQGTLSGTMVFKTYQHYLDFVEFVESAGALRIIYNPIGTEYFRDVDFEGIRDVVDKGSRTEAEVNFFCKSLWYTATDTRFTIEDIEGGSQYDLEFPYTFNDFASTDVVVVNDGHTESQLLVEFFGFIENPKIELYKNGVLKYSVEFDITVPSGSKLIYSAQDDLNYVYLQDESGVKTNVIDVLDLTKDNFFNIPKGTSKIVVTSDSGLFSRVTFTIISLYKSV